jgi:hypothetical protein
MVAEATAPYRDRPEPEEQRVIVEGVTYKDYVLIGDVLGHKPGLRLTFLRGTLEIRRTSSLHEYLKIQIARLVELHALVRGIRIFGYGSATYRREDKERGPDQDDAVRAYWDRLHG